MSFCSLFHSYHLQGALNKAWNVPLKYRLMYQTLCQFATEILFYCCLQGPVLQVSNTSLSYSCCHMNRHSSTETLYSDSLQVSLETFHWWQQCEVMECNLQSIQIQCNYLLIFPTSKPTTTLTSYGWEHWPVVTPWWSTIKNNVTVNSLQVFKEHQGKFSWKIYGALLGDKFWSYCLKRIIFSAFLCFQVYQEWNNHLIANFYRILLPHIPPININTFLP